jgi:hypothetical protein
MAVRDMSSSSMTNKATGVLFKALLQLTLVSSMANTRYECLMALLCQQLLAFTDGRQGILGIACRRALRLAAIYVP